LIINNTCLDALKETDSNSIDCIITSPPYWQLRDYGYPEQWGLEPTYQEYLEHLWQFMDECKRVLKDTGTAWINLGDTYGGFSGKMGAPTKWKEAGSHDFERPKQDNNKCLLLIPHRFAIGCIDRGWIMRNDIIWAKRNGMPESVTDRFSKKHEYFFFMVKNQKYYFDLDGIRDKQAGVSIARAITSKESYRADKIHNGIANWDKTRQKVLSGVGKNPGSVSDFWDVTTKGSSEKHYASFNFKLIEKCIIAGCPEGGTILDPFCGTATTLVRALQLNRTIIGIDASPDYCKIAERNIKKELDQTKLF